MRDADGGNFLYERAVTDLGVLNFVGSLDIGDGSGGIKEGSVDVAHASVDIAEGSVGICDESGCIVQPEP